MKTLFISMLPLLAPALLAAQADKTTTLYKTIWAKDSLLFNIGYNTCNIQQFEELLSDDFEFYHDKAGVTNSKTAFIKDVKEGLCKLSYTPRRQLVENSMKVYPLEKKGVLYGAIQTAEHQFYAIEKDKPEYLTSSAQFNHLWLLENGQWKLSRSLSYDHREPNTDTINKSLLFKDRVETERWLVKERVPALGIGYIEDGKIKQVTVYGRNEKGQVYSDQTIFNVASLTKPVTALVALKLVNAGKWDLDAPLYKYWTDPDIAGDPRSRKLTTRHILSHQTGFPNWRRKNPDGKLAFEFDPGTKYQYSGEGFEYLRKALEHKFNKPLELLAHEWIFKPLGMKDTRFYWDKQMDESRFAAWHRGDGTCYATYKNTSANGADDLLTTVEDYTRFILHIMNGAGVKEGLYREMISEQVRIKPRKYFGLGWWVDEDANGENALVHGGDDIGVHTIVFILPKSKRGLVIFTNCDNGINIYIPVIEHYLGEAGQKIIEIETK
jgi:CubicO group peptidase (beta-lactamase class C family)